MNPSFFQVASVLVVSVAMTLGCGFSAPLGQAPAATADINATADAAIQATTAAVENVQATIDTSVQKTTQALVPQASAPVTPVVITVIASTPVPEDYYYTLSEEELADLIDQAVNEALTASNAATASTTQATSDGSVTESEVQEVEVYTASAEELLAEVDAMMQAYTEIYGELAEESLALMQATEEILNEINDSLATITDIMEQGAQAATAAIEQLNAAAQNAQSKASETKDKAQEWQKDLQANLEKREQGALNIKPTKIPGSREEMIQSLQDYAKRMQDVLGKKGGFSPEDINNIAQLGANAVAGLKTQGGPQLSKMGDTINSLTRQVSRGQMPQARKGFDGFQRSIPRK